LFFRVIHQEPKQIPIEIVDKGCDKWKEKHYKNHPLFVDIIKTFKGTVL